MNKPLDNCPVCSGKMMITQLECVDCHTTVSSRFDLNPQGFDIEPELLNFIKVFIFAEGSIKQSEKLLNCSYPKIKNLLKKAKAALGVEDDQTDSENVIDRLDKGEIDVEEALRQLKKD